MSEVLLDEEYVIPKAAAVELASRHEEGLEVTMVWQPTTDSIEVAVNDSKTGEALILEPPKERALDAFHHPFAYVGKLALKDTYTPEPLAA